MSESVDAGWEINTQSELGTVSSAWHFGLFCCVYSSFHNRLDLIREPAFYWVFYFPNLSLFVSSYVKMKSFV